MSGLQKKRPTGTIQYNLTCYINMRLNHGRLSKCLSGSGKKIKTKKTGIAEFGVPVSHKSRRQRSLHFADLRPHYSNQLQTSGMLMRPTWHEAEVDAEARESEAEAKEIFRGRGRGQNV